MFRWAILSSLAVFPLAQLIKKGECKQGTQRQEIKQSWSLHAFLSLSLSLSLLHSPHVRIVELRLEGPVVKSFEECVAFARSKGVEL